MVRFFLNLLLIILALSIHAQNLKFKTYLTEDGLSNNSINNITIDKYGALWIGTWDGLNYYDGHQFLIYKHNPKDSTSISGNYIHTSIKDKSNHIWFLADDNTVSLLKQNHTFQNFKFKESILKIGLNADNMLIIQTQKKNYNWNGKKFTNCNTCTLLENKNDWAGLLNKYYPDLLINTTFKDSKGNIWLGTFKNGLFYIPANKIPNLTKEDIEQYTKDIYHPYGLNSNEIDAITEDYFGNIWLGTKDGGILRVFQNSDQIYYVHQHPEYQPYLPDETIRSILSDDQDIYLGFYTKGLYKKSQSNSVFKKINIKNTTDWNRIRSLYKSKDGSIWSGTYAGIFRIKNNNIQYYSAEDYPFLMNNRNYAFYQLDNQIYIACWGGVAIFDLEKNQFISFPHQNLLNKYHVRDILKIKNQLFLATERYGFIVFDGKNVKEISQDKNLADNSVYTLWFDENKKHIWIGTLGGISIYDIQKDKIVKNINEKDGLPSHLVYGILGDENYIWCSTTKGLATIDKKTLKIVPLPAEEGFQSREFSEGAYYRDDKGTLYFGGVNGLNYFNPNNINLDEKLPIIKLFVDDKIHQDIIEKTYRNNQISYTIDVTYFGEPKINKILYKLQGYDKQWNQKSYDYQKITYKDLPPGNYTFLVKNSLENDEVVVSKLVIKPPFWKTPIFYLIITIFILSLLFLIYFYNKKNHKKRETVLEQKIQERVATISSQQKEMEQMNNLLQEKNQLLQNQQAELQKLNAEMRSESIEIKNFTDYLRIEFKKPLSHISHLTQELVPSDKLKDISLHLNELKDKILAWDYLGQITPQDALQTSAINLEDFASHQIQGFIQKAESKGIKYKIQQHAESFWVEIDVLKFKLLLNYLSTDIFKYTLPNDTLYLSYNLSPQIVSFEIKSNQNLLKENLYNIQHYSPYYKAAKILAGLQNISFDVIEDNDAVAFQINFKPNIINPNKKIDVGMNWMHAGIEKVIDTDKNTILIWSKEFEYQMIQKLLNQNYNVLFEQTTELLYSILKATKVDILLIYNKNIDEEFLTTLHNTQDKYPKIKIIYLSESINSTLEQQLLDLGIHQSIQFPISQKWLIHQLEQVLDNRQVSFYQKESVYKILDQILEIEQPNTDEKLVHKAVNIVQKNMANSAFNVQMLYEELGISKIKCYRLFKDILDIPPSEFILNLKLKKAKSLLIHSNLNISEISYEVGFNDPKYFSKVFKKEIGKSPKKFKKDKLES